MPRDTSLFTFFYNKFGMLSRIDPFPFVNAVTVYFGIYEEKKHFFFNMMFAVYNNGNFLETPLASLRNNYQQQSHNLSCIFENV